MSISDDSAGGITPQKRPAKRIFRPLTDAQWNLARVQFETSDEKVTLKQISVLFQTSLSAVQKRSSLEKWSKGAQIVQTAKAELKRATENALAEVAQDAGREVARKLMDDLQPWIERQKREQIQRAIKRSKRGQKRIDSVSKGYQVYDAKRGSVVDLDPTPKDEMCIAAAEDKYDSIIRRNLGMNDSVAVGGPVNLTFLSNPGAVQILQGPA